MIGRINEISALFWGPFQFMILQNSVFLICILGLLFFFRGRSVRLLNVIALLGLIKLLVPPLYYIHTPLVDNFIFVEINQAFTSITSSGAEVSKGATLTGQSWLFLSWLAFASSVFVISLCRTYLLRRQFSSATPITVDSLILDKQRKNVLFLKSDKIHSPFVFGFWKHRMLLPRDWDSWSVAARKAVLAHELAHINHRDHWLGLLQLLVRSIYFFSPLVAVLNKKMDQYREIACDDSAVSSLRISPLAYTKQLVSISERVVRQSMGPLPASAFFHNRTSIKGRVAHQLSRRENSLDKTRLSSRLGSVALLIMFLPFSWYYQDKADPSLAPMDLGSIPASMITLTNKSNNGSTETVCVTYDEDGKPIDTVKPAPVRLTKNFRTNREVMKPLAQSTIAAN